MRTGNKYHVDHTHEQPVSEEKFHMMNFNEKADLILQEMREQHQQRMATLNEQSLPFAERYFIEKLDEFSTEVSKGTGLSYEYFVERLSSVIDSYITRLSPEIAKEVLALARRSYDYCNSLEIEEKQDWNKEHGFCCHHIELGCCPAGCGS